MLRCGSTEEGDEQPDVRQLGGARRDVAPATTSTSATVPCVCASSRCAPANGEVDTVVELGGAVASGQALNVPGSTEGLDGVGDDDLELISFGEQIGADGIALSFVDSADDVQKVRQHTRIPLIAKIEKPQRRRGGRGDHPDRRLA